MTKVFYLQQVDFGGYFLSTSSQVQLLSNYMLEFIELACERAVNLQHQKMEDFKKSVMTSMMSTK